MPLLIIVLIIAIFLIARKKKRSKEEAEESINSMKENGKKNVYSEQKTDNGNSASSMICLKTAEEMYEYCKNNNLGSALTKKWTIKHFQLLIDNLKPDEKVYCVFVGIHNNNDGNFAYAMTDKRCLMVKQKPIGNVVQSVNIENINDITFRSSGVEKAGVGLGTVIIDTFKEKISATANIVDAKNIYQKVYAVWEEVMKQNEIRKKQSSLARKPTEELKELKELLDIGVITQEEFDKKKTELLGL